MAITVGLEPTTYCLEGSCYFPTELRDHLEKEDPEIVKLQEPTSGPNVDSIAQANSFLDLSRHTLEGSVPRHPPGRMRIERATWEPNRDHLSRGMRSIGLCYLAEQFKINTVYERFEFL